MDCCERRGAADQSSATPAVGSGSGDTGSGLLWARLQHRVRAQVTRAHGRAQVTELRARWRAGHESSGARALY